MSYALESTNTFAAGDIEIGAVEIKNATDDTRASVETVGAKGALAVEILDGSGNQITSFGSGTQYTEGDVDATITGTAALMEVSSNTLQPIQGSVAGGLLVDLGTNNDVSLNAGVNNIGDVDIASVPAPLSTTGGGTEATALRVTLATDSTGVVSVDDNGGSLTVDSAQLPSALAAGGGLKVEGVAGGVAVPISAAALPLPSGAATSALQTQPGVDIGDVTVNNGAGASAVNVQDGGNSITVDGTVSVTGAVDTELPAAAALADNTANPTVPGVGAFLMGFDGTNWDRLQTGAATGGALKVDGSAVTQPISAASLPLPSGAATSALQTQPGVDIGDVTINNAAGASAVNVQDGGNSLTVDGSVSITGTPTVDTELPTAAALADAAANPTTPTVGAASLVYNGATWDRLRGDTVAQYAQGPTAHDAAKTGNPVRIGAVADTTEPTAVGDGDAVDLLADLNGKLVNMPYSVPERSISGVTASITGTANTSVIAAPGAGLRNYITHILVTNGHATVGTYVQIKDGTTVIYDGFAAAAGGGWSATFPKPLRLTANTALQAANVTTGSDTKVSASGFIAP